ncbi:MAG: thymidine kinase [Clostridia bacterium]|nr:thymidine kinase [Clostridia bacterium]
MSKLYFKFGAMGSSKTANALMTRFNYLEKNHSVWLIKPQTDTRDDYADEKGNIVTVVKSRIGLSAPANVIKDTDDITLLFKTAVADIVVNEELVKTQKIDVIICDECQFFTEEQIDQLKLIAEDKDIPVICFGLRSDFRTKLFPGSKRLFEIADSITEVKSICECGKKAIVNARFDGNGNIVTDGAQVDIGGNEKYKSMCWSCWKKLTNKQL